MQDVQSYQDLMIWQKGMDLAEETYRITLRLPREEQFALIDQLRRSAISIPSNIAEGYGRSSAKEYLHFLCIARGSKHELETQLLLCVRIGYLSKKDVSNAVNLCNEIGRMLHTLIKKLQR